MLFVVKLRKDISAKLYETPFYFYMYTLIYKNQ